MTDFRDLLRPLDDVIGPCYGTIAVTATDITDPVPVIIPDFDPVVTWGPCRWQSRDSTTLPAKGDQCLIVFDNRREPWIVAWWPFS